LSLIVAGTFRIPPENLAGLKPHLETVIVETRKEDGCLVYSYGQDVEDPGLIRVFELWRDQAALDAHFKAPHMIAWQAVRAEHGFHDRQLSTYDVSASQQI
jgi:quinol monooxygenase YgiN